MAKTKKKKTKEKKKVTVQESANIEEALIRIQQELNVPKSQYNKFGGFSYRSCEDILEAVKPLLGKLNLFLVISDDLVSIGNEANTRFYVKATVCLGDGKSEIRNTAYARETKDKKGMDSSQITGAASSYARKYALSGLFAIDDNKDADVDSGKASKEKLLTEKETKNISGFLEDINNAKSQDELDAIAERIKLGVESTKLKKRQQSVLRKIWLTKSNKLTK